MKYRIILLIITTITIIVLAENNIINISCLLKDNIDYSYIRSKSNILIGKVLKKNTSFVSSDTLKYKNIEKKDNSYKIYTDQNYVIKTISEGNVTFIGDIDKKGKSITLTNNGVDFTYSHIENINVNLYDYLDKNIVIGNSVDNYFYLSIKKDGKLLDYNEYI